MNYGALKKTAERLVGGNGADCTITRDVEKTYNKVTHSYDGDRLVIKGKAIRSEYEEKFIDGKTILQGDVRFVFTGNESPKDGDSLVFAGEEFKIINARRISPNGTNLAFVIQARK